MSLKLSKLNYGQVFLITVFILSTAMFSSLLALSPIRTKILQIKEMEYIYQSLANAEKAIEIGSYLPNNSFELPFNEIDGIQLTLSFEEINNTSTCSYYSTSTLGTCELIYVTTSNNSFMIIGSNFQTSGISVFQSSFYFGYLKNFSRVIIEAPR